MPSRRREAADPSRQFRAVHGTHGRAPLRRFDEGGCDGDRRRYRWHDLRRHLVRRAASRASARHGSAQPLSWTHDRLSLVDVKSIGAGGGSSPGSMPGGTSACRAAERRLGARTGRLRPRAAREPTVTDASLVLGYLDPDYLPRWAHEARPQTRRKPLSGRNVAEPLGISSRSGR